MARSMRNVDLNLLSIFVALMHDKNLSHTAEHLGMTQPAVSQALKRLRSLYNDPLFERKGGKMMPTFKAQSIFPTVKQILEQVVETLPEQEEFVPTTAKHNFHLNVLGIHHDFFVTDLIKQISQIAPDVALTISSEQTDDVEKSLFNREFDLHIDYEPNLQSGCHSEILFSDEVYVMARREHPRLSKLQHITMEDYLAEYHCILKPRTDNQYTLMRSLISDMDFLKQRKVRYKSGSALNIIEAVCATDFICVMPKNIIETTYYHDEIIYFKPPFKNETVYCYMTWHWATEHYQSQKWFRELVLKAIKSRTGAK